MGKAITITSIILTLFLTVSVIADKNSSSQKSIEEITRQTEQGHENQDGYISEGNRKMPFWLRLMLSIIFAYPILFVTTRIIITILGPVFLWRPLGFRSYYRKYIPWGISVLVAGILGFFFLLNDKHLLASVMFIISSACIVSLIPYVGNSFMAFLEGFRNIQFYLSLASGIYFCNVIINKYQLLAIGIGTIWLLFFVLYLIIKMVTANRFMASFENETIETVD